MTTQPDLEAKRLELAEKWPAVRCPEGHRSHHADCEVCKGEGKVYQLRKPCPGITLLNGEYSGCNTDGGRLTDCPSCQGRGYLANVTLETMLEACVQAGKHPHIGHIADVGWAAWVYPAPVSVRLRADTAHETPDEALLAAMLQIVREVSDAKRTVLPTV